MPASAPCWTTAAPAALLAQCCQTCLTGCQRVNTSCTHCPSPCCMLTSLAAAAPQPMSSMLTSAAPAHWTKSPTLTVSIERYAQLHWDMYLACGCIHAAPGPLLPDHTTATSLWCAVMRTLLAMPCKATPGTPTAPPWVAAPGHAACVALQVQACPVAMHLVHVHHKQMLRPPPAHTPPTLPPCHRASVHI